MMAQFYMRNNHLKSLGQKLENMFKLDDWLDENLDEFFEVKYLHGRFLYSEAPTKSVKKMFSQKSILG